jgi:myo-inositol-1(or 4)-monophosphatase
LLAVEPPIDGATIGGQLAAAAREAGAFALQKFRSPLKSWTKGTGASPVSEVDIAVDDMLRARLTAIDPRIAWLSEESVDDPARLSAQYVWVVDPIDGTRAFLAGRNDWVIAAALVRHGRPLAAAIFAPVDDILFLAAAGKGTTVNGRAVSANDGEGLEGARAAGPKRYLDAVSAAQPRLEALPKVHSLALRLARVADGTLDVAFAGENSHDWDVAAADLVVHEAGGALTSIDGRPLTYNRPNPVHPALVAAGRVRHEVVLQLMRGRQAAFA